jgi:hypothetical protein
MDDRNARIRARAQAIREQESSRLDEHRPGASGEFDRDAPTRGNPTHEGQALDADDVAEGGSGLETPAGAGALAALAATAGRG